MFTHVYPFTLDGIIAATSCVGVLPEKQKQVLPSALGMIQVVSQLYK